MVSGICSNSASLYERMKEIQKTINLGPSCIAIKVNPNFINKLHSSSKEDVFTIARMGGASSLDEYKSCRNTFSNTTELTNEDYQKEYNEYMQRRGCSNDEELKALNSTPYATKNELFNTAKMAMKGSLSSLKYCSGISISDDQISSLLSNASIQNVGKYINTSSTTVSDGVFKLQTLLDDICKQDNVDSSLKSSLTSLSNNISIASESIKKWSEQVDAYNKAQRGINSQSPKYNASLIASYQK